MSRAAPLSSRVLERTGQNADRLAPFILNGKPQFFPIVNATTSGGVVQMPWPENL
jgi:hypothetical protein